MPSINKVTLIGNTTADTPLQYTKNGKKVVNFTVATNETWKNKDGEVVKNTNFHKIVAWNGLADYSSKICDKGRLIYIEGKLLNRAYESGKGENRHVTEVIATQVRPLDASKKGKALIDLPVEELDVEVVECD